MQTDKIGNKPISVLLIATERKEKFWFIKKKKNLKL